MKPNFALNFTDDSITLLHRTKRGWAEIGSTPFAVDDLPAALATLRDKALEIAPEGITTKLVIPNSQIKYLEIAAPGPDAAKRRAQIAAGLEGQTPYDVADLVWDHWGKGPTVQVAVLARETLDEAEGFAVANGFNPVSFVAIPDDLAYAGEPFFGPSAHAASVLKAGEKVDRDQDPIRLADPKPATPATEPEPEPTPEKEPEPAPQPETTPLPDTEPVQVPPPEPEIVPEPLPAETPDPGKDPQPTPEPEGIPQPDPTPPAPVETPQDAPAYDPIPEPLTADLDVASGPEVSLSDYNPASIAATLSADDPPDLPEPEPTKPMTVTSVLDTAIADMDEAPMAVDVEEPDPVRKGPSVTDPSVEDDLPPMPSSAVLTALNGRGKAEAATIVRAPVAPRVTPVPATDRPAPKAERPAPRPPKFGYESPGERPAPPAAKGLRGLGALVTAPSIPGGKKARAAVAATAASTATASASAVAAASTTTAKRPSGLGSRPMPQRGKPRHLGLILTGLLLIMLALAAGLSSFYVSRNDAASEVETVAADLPAPEDEMLADGILPEDEMLADGVLPEEIAPEAAPEATADATEPTPPAPEAPAAGVVMQAADPNATPEPAPQNVAGGVPQAVPAPGTDPQDEIFLASSDVAPRTVDPAALPPPVARADALPQPPPPPPPPGTVYEFDENGLVRATPEGIVSPEGVLLTAGRPALVPPPRPESFAERATAAAAAAAATAATDPTAIDNALAEATAPDAAAEEVIIPSDPALADARPLPRPASLVPPPAAVEDDGAALAPLADPRLANLRPAARPADAAAAAVAQGIVAPVAASNNGSLALVAPEGTVTPMGLAISRRPAARPQDMARAIEEAVAAVARLPEPEIPDEIAPEAEPEPEEVASAAPRIPSTANVAKQATVRNAINLREVNLIGVYGTPSERYALVRNPNGRYIKVGVGDRLDGGRVAAITSSELRYEKRGRMVVLSLPNS